MSEDKEKFIELVDEDGKKEEFKELTTIEIEDERYIILIPSSSINDEEYEEEDDDDDDYEEEVEVVILKMGYDENGEMLLSNIEDMDELNQVIAVYEAMEDEII